MPPVLYSNVQISFYKLQKNASNFTNIPYSLQLKIYAYSLIFLWNQISKIEKS